jgi:hypothetical protein
LLFSQRAAAKRIRARWAAEGIELVQQIAGVKPECCLRAFRKRRALSSHSLTSKVAARTTIPLVIFMAAIPVFAQSPPAAPDRPWHSLDERQITNDGRRLRQPEFPIEPDKAYSLAELIDLAEAHNPETRVAWENARAQGADVTAAQKLLAQARSASGSNGGVWLHGIPPHSLATQRCRCVSDGLRRMGWLHYVREERRSPWLRSRSTKVPVLCSRRYPPHERRRQNRRNPVRHRNRTRSARPRNGGLLNREATKSRPNRILRCQSSRVCPTLDLPAGSDRQ